MSRAFGAFRAANMGEQEDAQEFLAFFLDQLHEEIVDAKKKYEELWQQEDLGGDSNGGGAESQKGEEEEEDAWLEVGKGGAKAVVNAPDPKRKVSNSSVVRVLFVVVGVVGFFYVRCVWCMLACAAVVWLIYFFGRTSFRLSLVTLRATILRFALVAWTFSSAGERRQSMYVPCFPSRNALRNHRAEHSLFRLAFGTLLRLVPCVTPCAPSCIFICGNVNALDQRPRTENGAMWLRRIARWYSQLQPENVFWLPFLANVLSRNIP